jgi:signal transduction histidine kinase
MLKRKLVLLIWFILTSNFFFGSEIIVDSSFKQTEIYNKISSDFINKHDSVFNIKIINSTGQSKELYLSIINPAIDKIELIESDTTLVFGDIIPFSKRAFKHSNLVYNIQLKANQSTQLQLKIYKQWEPLAVKIKLESENAFIKRTNHDNIFLGFFLGIFFMFLMILICFYIFSKSTYFLLYFIINLFGLIFYLLYSGIGYQYIWFYSVFIQKYVIVFASIGYFYFHIIFIQHFFTSQFKNNIYHVVLKIVLAVCLVFAAVLIALQLTDSSYFINFQWFYKIIVILLIFYTAVVFSLTFYAFRESKRREIIWIAVTMYLHVINWLIFINTVYGNSSFLNHISNFQLFKSSIFVSQINLILTITEMFVISMFIVYNYHFLVRKNNLSYKRLEYLQKRNINTFVLGQEEEREKITDSIESTLKIDIEKLQQQIQLFQDRSDESKVTPVVLKDLNSTLQDLKNITSNYVTPDLQNMLYHELIYTSTDKLNAEKEVNYMFDNIPQNFKLNAIANAHIYRVCQELSNNIFKHANATNVTVQSKIDQNIIILKFIDNGKGFMENNQKGLGLLNIESRINSLNGNINFLSNDKKGTIIHIILQKKDII